MCPKRVIAGICSATGGDGGSVSCTEVVPLMPKGMLYGPSMLLPAAMLRTHPIVAPDTGGPEPFGPGMLTKAPGATSLRTVRPLVWKLAVRVPTARSNAVLLPGA